MYTTYVAIKKEMPTRLLSHLLRISCFPKSISFGGTIAEQ